MIFGDVAFAMVYLSIRLPVSAFVCVCFCTSLHFSIYSRCQTLLKYNIFISFQQVSFRLSTEIYASPAYNFTLTNLAGDNIVLACTDI